MFKVEQSGQFRFSILLDEKEIHSVINTTPRVFSGIEAHTGRLIGGVDKVTYGSFRNLKLISKYCSTKKKISSSKVFPLANVYHV